jgi:hypothetical protein
VGYTASGGYELVLQDLNRDGKLDVVTAGYPAASVSVLYGNGDGTLGAPTSYLAGSIVQSVAVADINGDGLQDLVTMDDSNIFILFGMADGTFGMGPTLAESGGPGQLLLTDLNGDSRPELVVSNVGLFELQIFLNTSM